MERSNLERLQFVATALEELKNIVVFVGGATTELYVTDPAATEIRTTKDVDCVIKLTNYAEFDNIESLLRRKGFQNDTSPGAPICRWIYQDEKIDIMPDNEKIVGFSNRWYSDAVKYKVSRKLPNGIIIHILPITLFVATKLEALKGRGGIDYRLSHDFEDIIYIINNCPEFVDNYRSEVNKELKDYLKTEFCNLTSRPNIYEEIECALPVGDNDRIDYIVNIFNLISTN